MMIQSRTKRPMTHRRLIPILALALILVACGGPSATPTPSSTAPPAESATPEPTPEPTATPEGTATPAPSQPGTGFTVTPNPDADALFVSRETCESVDEGFRLAYPDAWFTNTAVGDRGPCAWFAPAAFEVDDPDEVPEGVVITIEIVDEDLYGAEDAPDRESGLVGETQNAVRVEEDGTYRYLVQLGPPGTGPTLVASTSEDLGGDYELNKAILDRIIATMEFIGSVG